MKAVIRSGIDNLNTVDSLLTGKHIGLMTNATGIDRNFRSTIDILRERYDVTALFAVEHGLYGEKQAGEEYGNDIVDGCPVYSMYGSGRVMTKEMTDRFDVFCFDIQDVGLRFYTYLYSLAYAMEACAAAGKSVIVFDRVNILGGIHVSGTMLDERLSSFVGRFPMPTRYGLTIGEYAQYVKDYLHLDIDLTIVKLNGWKREYTLEDIDIPWVAPSPNCATFHAAQAYYGTCIFEGTNVSEGRGTAMPFEYIGAPWIDAKSIAERLNREEVPGVYYRPCWFRPTFSKYAGEKCAGVQIHFTNTTVAGAELAALVLLDEIRSMYPEKLRFPETNGVYGFDRLLGTDEYRKTGIGARELLAQHAASVHEFAEETAKYHLY